MKITQIVFSPTGGTKRVADIITSQLGNSVNSIDLTDPKTNYSALDLEKNDIAVIAVPSYGGRVPALATKRISRICGKQMQCIILCVYGNRAYEDTLIELNDLVEKSGFHVIAAISAVAEHSIMRQYAAGRPDQKDKNELQSFANEIKKKIRKNDDMDKSVLPIPGNRPYKKAGSTGLTPKAGSKCVSCGICAQNCPAQAINKENIKIVSRKKCISCMRCASACPQAARKVNSLLVSTAAFAIRKACSARKRNELFI